LESKTTGGGKTQAKQRGVGQKHATHDGGGPGGQEIPMGHKGGAREVKEVQKKREHTGKTYHGPKRRGESGPAR